MPRPNTNKRSRRWCFTLNNYTEEECLTIQTAAQITRSIVQLHYGEEEGKEGTPHLQGFVRLAHSKTMRSVKVALGCSRVHLEIMKGTVEQSITYCSKEDDNPYTYGESPRPGTRTDLDAVREDAMANGMTEIVCWANMQEIRVAEKFLSYNERPRTKQTYVFWHWGVSGSGKTHMAEEKAKALAEKREWRIYNKRSPTKWFDGYDGHEIVIFDDFRSSWFKLPFFLGLIDKYECQVEVKGGARQFRPRVIFITSIYSPEQVYMNCVGEDGQREPNEQVKRRVYKTTHFNNVWRGAAAAEDIGGILEDMEG